jgi:aspartate aminotransferase
MTGWRIGFAAGPAPVIAAMRRLQSQTTSCANAAAQKAAAAALSGGPLNALKETLRARRDALMAGLAILRDFSPLPPAAGFYVFAGAAPWLGRPRRGGTAFPADSATLARVLLEEAGVALLPGLAFGVEGYLRLTFAPTPRPRIDEGVRRLREFFAG